MDENGKGPTCQSRQPESGSKEKLHAGNGEPSLCSRSPLGPNSGHLNISVGQHTHALF
uniref:Uncharacterized protein n=1 Tax=Setaria italica TaxID=4555 RepID=K3XQI5_SETIT